MSRSLCVRNFLRQVVSRSLPARPRKRLADHRRLLLFAVGCSLLFGLRELPAQDKVRIERDLLGEKAVPAEAYYGVQTARALENFQISGIAVNYYPGFVEAWAIVKLAAARANTEVGAMQPETLAAIEKACQAVLDGKYHDQFVVDWYQGGAGTSTNMNANEVLAIPHNGNLSNGRMFAVHAFDGSPLNRELEELRARMEPIVEVTQIKGDGEAHPFLSPNDEFADYETWDRSNLDGTEVKTQEMLQHEYARSALKIGLQLEKELGVNPFKYGMVGSTDAHTGISSIEEDNFFGKHSGVEPEPHRWEHIVIASSKDPALTTMGWQQASSGYAAVWATENTREAVFDAMKRKETYATTGSRITVRFFGGWDFTADDVKSRMPAQVGYDKGVPMGGDLRQAPRGKSPTFLVAAMKDPYSGNLDRIQIIKGWLQADGTTAEKIYDVAVSDDRTIGPDGRCREAVGDTVDVANATWTNTIGDAELIAVWSDPEFDSTQSAFYYARVIEIPTPRCTAYEAKRFNLQLPAEVPMTTQKRAYTSPVWYSPK